VFNKASCLDGPEPFSVAFGDANGEDTQLLFRLALAGKSFVWCPDAMVREFIETERCSPAYMITRMKRGSQHYAVSRIDTSDNPGFTRLKVTALGLAQYSVHAALFVLTGDWLRPGARRSASSTSTPHDQVCRQNQARPQPGDRHL
jgi:succinoglycan biosynthesis protein ExoM